MKQTEAEFLKALDKRMWTAADKLRSNLDAAVYKHVVLGLIFLIATIPFHHETLHAKDILGHVYEYFLGEFSIAEGKSGAAANADGPGA
jgi:type I restriction-modification system DNA methylase subunit